MVTICHVLTILLIVKEEASIFYRTNPPLRVLNISYLRECITFEISTGNKVCLFIYLYRSPSPTQDEFQTFRSNLKLNLDALLCSNPFLTVMIGDFNAKSNDWCSIDITSFEGSELDFLTSHFGLSQIIKKPTVILDNSRSSIDLIFTSQPNMIIDSGVHTSLHSNCHHQMIYAKLDLKIIDLPPYERTVWHFKNTNSDHIKRVISFITNETITCDDRDPPWMNSFIKTLIRT